MKIIAINPTNYNQKTPIDKTPFGMKPVLPEDIPRDALTALSDAMQVLEVGRMNPFVKVKITEKGLQAVPGKSDPYFAYADILKVDFANGGEDFWKKDMSIIYNDSLTAFRQLERRAKRVIDIILSQKSA